MRFKVGQQSRNRGVPNPGYLQNKSRLDRTLNNCGCNQFDVRFSGWLPTLAGFEWVQVRATSDSLGGSQDCPLLRVALSSQDCPFFATYWQNFRFKIFLSLVDFENHPKFLKISYRVSTPIPITFVAIRVAKKISVASLKFFASHSR